MPHSVKKLGDGWVIQECSIQMNGRTLKEIRALCYKPKQNSAISTEYYALLGDIKISSSRETPKFPPSTSWLLGGEFVLWSSSPKRVSLKLMWRLKDGEDDYNVFGKYNVYLKKQKSESDEGGMLLLGVVGLRCFYVSDVEVASDVKSLRFIIQVCSVDGSCQKIQDSPSYVLQVQGTGSIEPSYGMMKVAEKSFGSFFVNVDDVYNAKCIAIDTKLEGYNMLQRWVRTNKIQRDENEMQGVITTINYMLMLLSLWILAIYIASHLCNNY